MCTLEDTGLVSSGVQSDFRSGFFRCQIMVIW
jgi:hypothetical protein